jgi:virginiamycin B lyase
VHSFVSSFRLYDFLLLIVFLLTACSATASSDPVATSGPVSILPATVGVAPVKNSSPTVLVATTPHPVQVILRYRLPTALFTQSKARRQALDRAGEALNRSLQYISASNTSITIGVTPLNGSTTTYGPTPCTTGSCAITFTANSGPNTLAFTFKDGSGNILSSFATTQIVPPSGETTLNFTADAVVDHVALSLAAPSVNAGTIANDTLTVNAYDKDNNIITGSDGYVDANGNQVVLTLLVSNTQSGGTGTTSIQGLTVFVSPTSNSTNVHYDGKWLASSTITVNSSSSAITSLAPATLTITPYATEYAIGTGPYGIIGGSDGNVWFTEWDGAKIGKISTSGTNLTTYSCAGCLNPGYMMLGPDGNIWYTDFGNQHIDKISPTGTASIVTSVGGQPAQFVKGPDGKVWYASYSSSTIGNTSSNGTTTTFSLGQNSAGVGLGPDGNLWYTQQAGTSLFKVSLRGVLLATYTLPSLGANSEGVVTGPDGNLWLVNYGSSLIEKITSSGNITSYSLQAGATPTSIIVGPDGYLWFTETGKNTIGRISTSGILQEFTNAANGLNSSSGPWGLTIGPDGNIWVAEYGSNSIAKFIF